MAAAMLSRNADNTNTSASSTTPPFQSSGNTRGSRCGTLALLEMPRQQRETHEQREQIGEDHPLLVQVPLQAQPVPAGRGSRRTTSL